MQGSEQYWPYVNCMCLWYHRLGLVFVRDDDLRWYVHLPMEAGAIGHEDAYVLWSATTTSLTSMSTSTWLGLWCSIRPKHVRKIVIRKQVSSTDTSNNLEDKEKSFGSHAEWCGGKHCNNVVKYIISLVDLVRPFVPNPNSKP
jgi:hypothetical protein